MARFKEGSQAELRYERQSREFINGLQGRILTAEVVTDSLLAWG